MKGLNYFQACDLWLQGKALRREAWHRWITWEHWMGWITQPAVDGLDPFRRVVRDTDFTDLEYNAVDWTDEPWDTAFPAPIVAPSVTPGSGSSGGTGGHGGTPTVLWGGGVGGGGGGNPGHPVPDDPPAVNPAVITITYQSDLMPGGNACLLPSQFGTGQTCTVIMTVAISGGPAGVFGLHIQLGSESKPPESGYNGYTRDFSFTETVNASAHLTPNVIYHPTGGDVTQSTPLFDFQAACKTVTFAVNGGTGSMAAQSAGAPAPLNANVFTREGYTFSGWNVAADGSGTAYANGESYAFAFDITLYAQWAVAPHTVTFLANGGTGSMSPETSAFPTALTANTFTLADYTFSGWNTAADGSGTAYADGATYDFAADLTMYAQWTAIPPHTVTFDGHGGTGSMSPQTDDAPAALNSNLFTREGYTFTGWNTLVGGGGTAYADNGTFAFDANATLYAQWGLIPVPHTVTFDGNGNDGGSMSPQTATAPAPLTTNAFTRAGFTFGGWNTVADGSGTAYAENATYPFAVDVTLYAQWS